MINRKINKVNCNFKCMLRIITGLKLRWLLIASYDVVFILSFFTDSEFLATAFDSGGVTTGPMTVPFILALGVGVSFIRSDKNAEADSFGLVALSSIGPIIAVMILGFFHGDSNSVVGASSSGTLGTTADIGRNYIETIPHFMLETALSLLPVIVIFFLFQLFALRMDKRSLAKICIGILYTYIGLVLFLTGVNVGFANLGAVLGARLVSEELEFLLIPLSMLLGWFIISAEPAVGVLETQIYEVSAGAIPGRII